MGRALIISKHVSIYFAIFATFPTTIFDLTKHDVQGKPRFLESPTRTSQIRSCMEDPGLDSIGQYGKDKTTRVSEFS